MQHAREVNQAVAEVARTFEVGDTDLHFFCECGADDCTDRLSLPIRAYDALRAASEPLLVDGHPLVRAADASPSAAERQAVGSAA